MAPRPTARRVVAGTLAGAALSAVAAAQLAAPPASNSAIPAAVDGRCHITPNQVAHEYTVLGRVRLLLVWTGRHEIGEARIGRSKATEGRRLDLLIGTDPSRAPRKMNRWGYITETVCGTRAHMLGLMTPTDEETIEEAQDSASVGPYRLSVIRATQDGGAVRTERFRVGSDPKATYRDLDARLAALPPPGVGKPSMRPTAADSGFLFSVDAMLHEMTKAGYVAGKTPAKRTYIYGGRLYELSAKHTRPVAELMAGGVTYRSLIEGAFEIRNLSSGEVTPFELTVGTTGPLAGVPVRIVYGPRWWLEIELDLKGPPQG